MVWIFFNRSVEDDTEVDRDDHDSGIYSYKCSYRARRDGRSSLLSTSPHLEFGVKINFQSNWTPAI